MDEKHLRQYRELGLTIAYYRKLKGMSQQQLADATGISRTHVSNIEAPNARTSVSLDKLFSIADALEIPVKNLFSLHG
ncbi:MAG TPA: helix-turn-helix domain-containing protein [Candidatus Blautia avistercoris]|uniref:helix-turn-helix domain-containing protein n=1 Tax=Blautia sp. An249 TaxID=1965603 RepID=UPI000B3813A9|nr:helix-turn-helix transcriptional regulator [Blautia sp. An249]OUO77055.1 transcriptional regulator [Blautia sp. An249]HIY18153.1 helix-turn-helix domain-containing protein [Candidatus Blautia avistercoris]